jgi:hypothetical protein
MEVVTWFCPPLTPPPTPTHTHKHLVWLYCLVSAPKLQCVSAEWGYIEPSCPGLWFCPGLSLSLLACNVYAYVGSIVCAGSFHQLYPAVQHTALPFLLRTPPNFIHLPPPDTHSVGTLNLNSSRLIISLNARLLKRTEHSVSTASLQTCILDCFFLIAFNNNPSGYVTPDGRAILIGELGKISEGAFRDLFKISLYFLRGTGRNHE